MRARDALLLAAVLLAAAFAFFGLSMQTGGGMMGGMMGGSMLGFGLAFVIVVVAVAFLVFALAGATGTPPAVPPPPYVPLTAPPPAPPPAAAEPVPAVTSDVEAAVVRMLDEDERLLYLRLRDAGAPVLQKDIVGWGTFSAAKVTRLLDRLERKGLVVRERAGATNRIRLTRQPAISGK